MRHEKATFDYDQTFPFDPKSEEAVNLEKDPTFSTNGEDGDEEESD